MQIKKVVYRHKWSRKNITMACQECFEIFICWISLIQVFKLNNVKVLLSMEKFVLIIGQKWPIFISILVPLWKMVPQED